VSPSFLWVQGKFDKKFKQNINARKDEVMKKQIEYYDYISTSRVREMFQRIPRTIAKELSGEIGFSLPFSLLGKVSFGKSEVPVLQQLLAVCSYLEKHQSGQIGTVDQPKSYIAGAMPLFYRFLPQGFGVKEDEKPELAYFGGSTPTTILALGGPYTNIFREGESGRLSTVSSSLPHLVCVLAKEYHMISSHPRFRQKYDESQALDCISYMDRYEKGRSQLRKYSFLAKVKLDSEKVPIYNPPKRILLASPIFVAAED
jgi:hypothetical protein